MLHPINVSLGSVASYLIYADFCNTIDDSSHFLKATLVTKSSLGYQLAPNAA